MRIVENFPKLAAAEFPGKIPKALEFFYWLFSAKICIYIGAYCFWWMAACQMICHHFTIAAYLFSIVLLHVLFAPFSCLLFEHVTLGYLDRSALIPGY